MKKINANISLILAWIKKIRPLFFSNFQSWRKYSDLIFSFWIIYMQTSVMQKNVSCFQFIVQLGHFSCLWMAHIAGPPVSCSIRVGPGGYILATNLIIFHPNMLGMNILPQFRYYHTLEIMMFLETKKKYSNALKSQIK